MDFLLYTFLWVLYIFFLSSTSQRIEYNLILEYLVFQIKICFQYHKRRQRWTISLLCDYYAVWYKWSKSILSCFCDVIYKKNLIWRQKKVVLQYINGHQNISVLTFAYWIWLGQFVVKKLQRIQDKMYRTRTLFIFFSYFNYTHLW